MFFALGTLFLPPPVPEIVLAEKMTERAVLRQAVQTFDPPPALGLCLGTVTARTQRLQVGQVIRAALRLGYDMVHVRSGRDTADSGTLAAEIRVTLQYLLAQETPAATIATCRTAALAGAEPAGCILFVPVAITGNLNQATAAGMPAYHFRSCCHVRWLVAATGLEPATSGL